MVSSHLLSEIEQIATRVLIIDNGKRLVEGTAEELFDPSQTIITLDTTDNNAALELLLQSAWGGFVQPQRNRELKLKLNREQIPQLHIWLVQQGIGVLALQPRHSLEDYFLQVTSHNQHVEAFTN